VRAFLIWNVHVCSSEHLLDVSRAKQQERFSGHVTDCITREASVQRG